MTSALCVLLLTPSNKLLINRLENPTTFFTILIKERNEHKEKTWKKRMQNKLKFCSVALSVQANFRNPEIQRELGFWVGCSNLREEWHLCYFPPN